MASKEISLVLSIQKPSQLRKILRELDVVENNISERHIREDDQSKDLNLSFNLKEMVESNELDLTNATDLKKLRDFLEDLQTNAKVMHFSFSQPTSELVLNKLTEWLRKNIDPNVLLTTGLNNSVGAGFLLRTTNKYFDFSIGNVLRSNRELLVKKISEVNKNATS